MKVITKINDEFLENLNIFKDWVFDPQIQSLINDKFSWPTNIFHAEGKPERAASKGLLESIQYADHSGFPIDMFGLDFNYSNLKKTAGIAHESFFEKIRTMNKDIDDRFQSILGAYHPALKAFYPENGYIAWHTNWNAPGYNLIFSYSKNGNGYWRHVDSAGSTSIEPDLEKIVEIKDTKGWHCKAGYFGSKEEYENIVWHSAFTKEPRLTLSYVFKDRELWEDVLEEIEL